ncbi:MAG TPA: zf-TFIIB domain-containing protein [Dehalococcoidia bacterium]|nr:zf-TFIIB domain-containing protein [Dehalococcoidia bacterium]
MKCPRCQADLVAEQEYHGIVVDRCPSCEGRWLDHDELDQVEATVPSTPEERRATIRYAEHQSELRCPVCSKPMTAFDYRAYDLELDACDEHGFWLDAGEEARVRAIVEERVRGLARAAAAEAAWGRFLSGLKGKRLFGRK